jgi:hypothetical protein
MTYVLSIVYDDMSRVRSIDKQCRVYPIKERKPINIYAWSRYPLVIEQQQYEMNSYEIQSLILSKHFP